jgi:hypothetical protein
MLAHKESQCTPFLHEMASSENALTSHHAVICREGNMDHVHAYTNGKM